MGAKSKASPARVKALEVSITALEYRKAGCSYAQIAIHMNLSKSGAYKAVRRGLEEMAKTCTEKAEEVRSLEAMRLDRMWNGLYEQANRGDTTAINTALRIMERRAKLWGIDLMTPAEESVERKEITFRLMKGNGNGNGG